MNQKQNVIGFLLSCFLSFWILILSPFDELRLGSNWVAEKTKSDPAFLQFVSSHCHTMLEKENQEAEKILMQKWKQVVFSQEPTTCQLEVNYAKENRYSLVTAWNYKLSLLAQNQKDSWSRSFSFTTLRPLALFPFAVLLLALLFDFTYWGFLATALGVVLFSYAFDVRTITQESYHTLTQINQSDKSFTGILLVGLWICLYRANAARKKRKNTPTKEEALTLRVLGILSPSFFTLASRIAIPFRRTLDRLKPLLSEQLILVCLSLYFFQINKDNVSSFLFPRYFTFAVLFFYVVPPLFFYEGYPKANFRFFPEWKTPMSLFLASEVLAWFFMPWQKLPLLTRLGIALVVSELVLFKTIRFQRALREWVSWMWPCLLATILIGLSFKSGLTDLTLHLIDPVIHPSSVNLFTFLLGLGLGFFTGHFASSFFLILSHFALIQQSPILRACLIDGILAGVFCSPFSLINLLPMNLFQLPFQNLLKFRFQQIGIPLCFAIFTYGISGLTPLGILRPVTFIVMCLVTFAFYLKKHDWRFGNWIPLPGELWLTLRSGRR